MTRTLALVALAGCAHDVTARYAPEGGGTVQVLLSHAASAVTVAIDDQVVIERAHTSKATISGVPPGDARVRVVVGGVCAKGFVEERHLWVQPGRSATLALPGPELTTACAIVQAGAWVAVGLEIVGLAILSGGGMRHARR
jgi:hypothetical protein